MSQHVIVKEYNFDYPKMYQEEEKKIKKFLKDNPVFIEHIGSTAIPNLKSKPIIDILISVNSLEDVALKKMSLNKSAMNIWESLELKIDDI